MAFDLEQLKVDLPKIAHLNAVCFGKDDEFCRVSRLLHTLIMEDGMYYVHRLRGEIVAYILLSTDEGDIHCVRRGVVPAGRRRGLATKLTRKGIKYAQGLGKKYKTYTSTTNLASFNSNIRAGLILESATEEWLSLTSR